MWDQFAPTPALSTYTLALAIQVVPLTHCTICKRCYHVVRT